MDKFIYAIIAIFITAALVPNAGLPLWGNILIVISCISTIFMIFRQSS